MKKLNRVLALVMALCMLTVGGAFAEGSNLNLYQRDYNASYDENVSVNTLAALGDTLYLVVNDSDSTRLEAWKQGDTETTLAAMIYKRPQDESDVTLDSEAAAADAGAADEAAAQTEVSAVYDHLFADGDTLYGMSSTGGEVWKIADASGALAPVQSAVKLAWDKMTRNVEDYSYTPGITSAVVMDGTLYLLTQDWNTPNSNGYATRELMSWNLSTGELIAQVSDKFICDITAYKDGLLLCKVLDEANAWDSETGTSKPATLATYNPATGELATLFDFDEYSVYGLNYSAANDTLYFGLGTKVMKYAGVAQPAQVSAYVPNSIWEETELALIGNTVAVGDYSGLALRELDSPSIQNGALTVYGEYSSSGHMAYLNAHPEAPITISDNNYSTLEEFTNAMVSDTNSIDVLRLNSNYAPLTRLISKGYAMDLTQYAELKQYVDEMYPQLTSICYQDGKLYGVPVTMSAESIGYNKTVWADELGLTDADLPTSFAGLLDFIANWAYDYGDEHPDINLLDTQDAKYMLLNYLMENYTAYSLKTTGEMRYDTDLFRKLLTALDAIDYTEVDPPADTTDDDWYSKRFLFSTYSSPSQLTHFGVEDQTSLILPLDDGLEPVLSTQIDVFIVNPKTTRVEQAIEYLTTYVQNLEPESAYITMYADHDEPYLNPNFEAQIKDYNTYLAQEQKALETSQPEDIAAHKENIEYYRKWLDNSEQYRYYITAEDIANYRATVAPYLYVTGQTPLNIWGGGDNQFYTLEQQYLQGAMTADQYMKEIDKRIRMMQLEDQ